jgi:hypothetical protein
MNTQDKNQVSATSNAVVPAASSTTPAKNEDGLRFPSNETMLYCVKLALSEDKPIMMDYWVHSIKKLVFIGIKDDGSKEKILVRSAEEYTSPIGKIYKNGNEHILVTENSIYVVDVGIPLKKFSI